MVTTVDNREKKAQNTHTMKHLGLTLTLVFLLIPFTSQAETVLRTGTDISVDSDQVVDGDYYVSVGPFGKTIMSGGVSEDMYAFGASVTVNGTVGEDVSILAGTAQVHAPVTDDVRVIGGEVTLAEDVGGDVFVLGGTLTILSTAKVHGDVFFFGGDLLIEGDIDGSVHGSAQRAVIDSTVGKNIDMKVTTGITLGDKAHILGSVTYTSFSELTRSQSTIIDGSVQKNDIAADSAKEKMRGILMPMFIALFATLSLYLLFKREVESLVQTVEGSFAKSALIGSLVIILGPITALLLTATVLGLFVGLITFAVVLLLYIVGLALSSAVLGAFILKFFTKKLEVNLIAILVGALCIQGVMFIPIIGAFSLYVLFAVTVGALTHRMYRLVA